MLGQIAKLSYACGMVALVEALGQLIVEVAEQEIVPRYQRLEPSDVIRKPNPNDPNDLVTSADRAAEQVLSRRLRDLLPGSVVVGEEATAENPKLLDALRDDVPVWLVDPVDGTKNFARGEGPFGSMVALAKEGELLLSGIYLVQTKDLYLAERGAGATRNGAKLCAAGSSNSTLRGTIYQKYFTAQVRELLELPPPGCDLLPVPLCAAFEYARLARGEADFAVFYRLFPWDHTPGALLLGEVGGVARGFDGAGYRIDQLEQLLLVAPRESVWRLAQERLRKSPTRLT